MNIKCYELFNDAILIYLVYRSHCLFHGEIFKLITILEKEYKRNIVKVLVISYDVGLSEDCLEESFTSRYQDEGKRSVLATGAISMCV